MVKIFWCLFHVLEHSKNFFLKIMFVHPKSSETDPLKFLPPLPPISETCPTMPSTVSLYKWLSHFTADFVSNEMCCKPGHGLLNKSEFRISDLLSKPCPGLQHISLQTKSAVKWDKRLYKLTVPWNQLYELYCHRHGWGYPKRPIAFSPIKFRVMGAHRIVFAQLKKWLKIPKIEKIRILLVSNF